MNREDNEIWMRQPKEPARAFHYFSVFRDLGSDRSLPALAEKVKKTLSHMRSLSAQWEWFARAMEFDGWQLIQREKFEIVDRAQMRKRPVGSAMAVQQKLIGRLNSMTAGEIAKLPFATLVYAMDVAQRLEREARSEVDNVGGVAKVEFIVHAPTEPIPFDEHKQQDDSQHHNLPQSVTLLSR